MRIGKGVPGPKAGDPVSRIMRRVVSDERDCWVFTGPLTYGYAGANLGRDAGARICRTCKAAYQRRLRAARRAA